jgi:formylglycine-generating enzyme required for sulfatase activity
MVVLAGDSGVGKSSLCRAGILPRIDAWLEGERTWSVATVVPGRHPVEALCAAIEPYVGDDLGLLVRTMTEDPSAVARGLRSKLGAVRGLVLFFDQLEELVTMADRDEAAITAHAISWLSALTPCIRLLATVRGDFLSRLAGLEHVGDSITRSLFFVKPLSRERVREAITGPAGAQGVEFESQELVDSLVASTVRSEGGLPVLQFTLSELWEMRDTETRCITQAAYEQIGGMDGALSRHADELVARMTPSDREVTRRVLLHLLTEEGTRARRTQEELTSLDQRAETVLDTLVRGRLVVAKDSADGPSYEIAHEALTKRWGTLARWLSADAEAHAARLHLGSAVSEWERHRHAPQLLWRAPQLDEVALLDIEELGPRERDFVTASRRAHRRRRVSGVAAILAVPMTIALVYGGVTLKARADLDRRVDREVAAATSTFDGARQRWAEAQERSERAYDLFDARDPEAAEPVWETALEARDAARTELARAGQQLEPAIMLSSERSEPRRLFAEVLFERARLASEARLVPERDEALQRLSLYDDEGVLRRRWEEPAAITLEVEPQDAELILERYVTQTGGGLRLERVGLDRSASPQQVSLPPGSYLVQARAASRASVRYPFVVRRGEARTISFELPSAEAVPEGFVYAPPGTFLFGSTAPDDLRRSFYHAVPIHQVSTGGYLIARQEVTFGEWIVYLEDLTPEERQTRAPRATKGGFGGALQLEETDDGVWRLTYQPTTHSFVVLEGELMRYEGRRLHDAVDWRRLPVVGILAADAEAYTRWLDRSGRVRRARLCTEVEWERAGRGADGRLFPQGDVMEPEEANFDQTYGRHPLAMGPDEVGTHPASRSPFGLDDMAGNVWEWTSSPLGDGHAARGGSFYHGVNAASLSNRETPEPSFRDVSVGFRVCADMPG